MADNIDIHSSDLGSAKRVRRRNVVATPRPPPFRLCCLKWPTGLWYFFLNKYIVLKCTMYDGSFACKVLSALSYAGQVLVESRVLIHLILSA